MLTIERLRQLQDIIKVTTLAEKAGLNSNSIRAKLHSNRELTVSESAQMEAILKRYGLSMRSKAPSA